MAGEGVRAARNGFAPADPASEWYTSLDLYGSCKKLCDLLEREPQLLHRTGAEGVTALHKAVRHGCVRLTRHILVDMFDGEGKCKCGLEVQAPPCLTRDDLLRQVSSDGVTAVHIAMVNGSPRMVKLLKWAIDMGDFLRERELAGQVEVRKSSEELSKKLYMKSQVEILFFRSIYRSDDGSSAGNRTSSTTVAEETPVAPEVPSVTDGDIDGIYGSEVEARVRKVYGIIEGVLEDCGADSDGIEALKEACQRHVDFEFSPVAHVFFHFLGIAFCACWDQHKLYWKGQNMAGGLGVLCGEVLRCIIEACNRLEVDEEEGMLETLFNLHDPQGRTFHGGYEADDEFAWRRFRTFFWLVELMKSDRISPPISPTTIVKCMNARDASGRTFLHRLSVLDSPLPYIWTENLTEYLNFEATVQPLCRVELSTLWKWCFPNQRGPWLEPLYHQYKPIHLMVLFNSSWSLHRAISNWKHEISGDWYGKYVLSYLEDDPDFVCFGVSRPLQMAAYLGRTAILEDLLQHHRKYNSIRDPGLGYRSLRLPAICCAALAGQVEAIQSILKYPVYDPIVEDSRYGTALHVAVKQSNVKVRDLQHLQAVALMCTLPDSEAYRRIKKDFARCEVDEDGPRMYSANEKACINVLLQAGIDIWTPHPRTKQFPTPGPMANDEAQIWWYDKVVKEVVDARTSIGYASNATSVVAALVATASFIGPLQPPLGYSSADGFIQADRSPVRAYLVCNSLSFYFSVASILMAVLPAIPMPKESLYDELVRSRRCLKASALMLLVSMMCVLMSFSSASVAVVSDDWREKGVVVGCIVVGGAVCAGVLVVYIIRLLRMVYHGNAGIRRRFAKYMYF